MKAPMGRVSEQHGQATAPARKVKVLGEEGRGWWQQGSKQTDGNVVLETLFLRDAFLLVSVPQCRGEHENGGEEQKLHFFL